MKVELAVSAARGAVFLLFAQGLAVQAAEVKVFSGGGFRSVVTEVAPIFEHATGHKVVATFGSNDDLERRIKAGERFDVLLIGTPTFDALGGRIAREPRAVVGRAGLGVAVRAGTPKPDISSADALKGALLATSSVSYVGDGLSGALFIGLLKRLGIAEPMKPKLKPTSVGNVAKAVANGEADLVVHVIPGILAEGGVELVGPVPAEIQSHIDLTAGLNAAAGEPEAGKAFITFLRSAAATSVIKAKGW